MNVTYQFEQIRFPLTKDGAVAPLRDMAGSLQIELNGSALGGRRGFQGIQDPFLFGSDFWPPACVGHFNRDCGTHSFSQWSQEAATYHPGDFPFTLR
jgi:hypothetical protein